MANRRLTKLDKYIESRLWNTRLKDPSKRLPTRVIIRELIRYYGLVDGAKSDSQLRKMVNLARRRVYRKRAILTKNIGTWAQELNVPEYLIERWAKNGLLDEKNIDTVAHILKDYKEFLSDTF